MLDLFASNFFLVQFLSVVLMDMPKVASVIELLSSDESYDSNDAIPVREKNELEGFVYNI